MGEGGACSHFRGDPDRFYQLLRSRSGPQRGLRVALDAVRALRHMGHRHRYQLLRLVRKSAIRKHGLAERLKGGFGLWRQLAPLLGALRRGLYISLLIV